MDYTSPNTQFTFDLNGSTLFKKDECNYINVLGIKNLNTLENISLLDIFLSKANVVEPHYHQNAAELVYCISGSVVVSIINPFTNELLHFPLLPGQVANIPQGWWHYEVATADCTHLLAIFDAPTPEVILGSDILSKTPANVLAHTYCLNEALLKEALAGIQPGTLIGPPADCCKPSQAAAANMKGTQTNPVNMMPANVSPMNAMNAAPYMYPSAPQPFGYQPMAVHGYYAQPSVPMYRQQPYYQANPGAGDALKESGNE
ncbi:cupin domain-containing protein [Paenibacillus sp. MMS20-IR301]|nr:cupin domain-containing protein [Paenibacillus sp. MMS20-IR301]WNS45910.1 cupin domain-containing protein [Paenibacillus sp. MMS20-IR301]